MKRFANVIKSLKATLLQSGPKKPKKPSLMFGKYLLVTNTLSSGVLMLIGDMVAQEISIRTLVAKNVQQEPGKSRYDYNRLLRMGMVGLLGGPVNHYTYKWLEKLMPGKSMNAIFKKIATDQFISSPIFIAFYFYAAGLLERKPLKACTEELKSKFVTVFLADLCIWPPSQFLNFYVRLIFHE